jgi:alkaline phosphatase D
MMKIAFASCMLQQRFENQAVWQRIQAQDPDHLVLLGNSIHLDIDAAVKRMSAGEFAEHAHGLYRGQLAVPEFDALLRHMAAKDGRRVFAIWDDHDFLWHDAAGADIDRDPTQRDKLEPSRVLFQWFRRALTEVGSFPARLDEITPPTEPDPAPLYESLPLRSDLWLHLTDGRSHRTETWLVPQDKRALLGGVQLDAIATAVATADAGAVHLVASGSTSSGWKRYLHDWTALGALATRHRLLMLSGDVLHNAFATHVEPQGWPLHEATSSGAAVRDAIVYGAEVENFALAEIEPAEVRIRFFERDGETAPRRIARESWAVVTKA